MSVTIGRAIILGSGGHAGVLIELLRHEGRFHVIGITDPVRKDKLWDIPIIGNDDAVLEHDLMNTCLVNGLGNRASRTNPGTGPRTNLYKRFANWHFPALRHRSAIVASNCHPKPGSQIMAGAVIQNNVEIGENTIINSGAVIEHDCRVGPHCHIAPGAILCGSVKVGEGSHIGAGAVVLGGVNIGKGCVVAAGAVVTRSLVAGGFADRQRLAA